MSVSNPTENRKPSGPPTPAEERAIDEAYNDLLQAYLATNHRRKVEIIERAFRFARQIHHGARRLSGEPYIMHPLAVARIIVSEFGLGSTSICAALLHDVCEDAEDAFEEIEATFGKKIASITAGVAKISGGIFGDKASVQAESFRKLLLSMSTDIRVVLIKMADRLHNMRTISYVPEEKGHKICRETLYVYSPIAHRLGLNKIKTELEELAFRHEFPAEYDDIQARIEAGEKDRMAIVEKFVAPLRARLDAAGFRYEIKARVKSAWSIYNKMHSKNIPFDQIYDIYALRIIFENDDESLEKLRCWQIYTYVTDGNPPHPDRLRDWISTPKANGYSALHVTVMGPDGRWVEVQIRSRKMDEIAELGYAAHWKYKTGEYSDGAELESWMNTIKDILASPDPDGVDVLDTIKLNLYSPEIYVFTPRGDLKTLPSGSTVLDFAFEVHTDLGMQCVAGKINHKLVPLSHVLDSGDQIEIITSRTRRPAPEWLRFCRTAKAKSAIRALYQQNDGSTGAYSNTIAFKLFIEGTDRIGMLASITHRLSQIMRSDIRQLESSASDGKFSCTATVARIPDNNPEKLCSSLLEIDGVDSAHFTNI